MPVDRRLALAVLSVAALPGAALAQTTFVETYDDAANVGGWSWGTGGESVVPLNGNPGGYLQDLTLASCCPTISTAPGNGSVFTGDWRNKGVSSIGIDLITLDTDFGIGTRPLTLLLTDDGGTPEDLDDDAFVWFVGDTLVPAPGVPIFRGSGWTPFDFAVPVASATLPAGWTVFTPDARTDDQVWNDVIEDVDVASFYYGDPLDIFLFNSWDVGLDNPRITYQQSDELPVLVTFDDAEYRGWTILGFDDAVFEPEGGNPGAHLNFFNDNFFIRVYDEGDPAFTGDYSRKGRVEISADLRWRTISFGGTPVQRDLFFMIWDDYVDEGGVARKHVLLRQVGKVRGQGANAPWKTSRVRLPDPASDTLPGGWYYWPFDGGIEPTRTLPDGVTVASIMSSVDRVQWSTATPGLFFGFTLFDVSVDNCAIRRVQGGGPGTTGGGGNLAGGVAPLVAGPSGGAGTVVSADGQDGVEPLELDLETYLALWRAGDPLADFTTTGAEPGTWGHGIGDGVVDLDDLRHVRRLLRGER